MRARSLNSDLTYIRALIGAGWKGAVSVREQPWNRSRLLRQTRSLVTPAVLGAGLGALSVIFRKDRRSVSGVASAGLIGSVVGVGAGAAWASRDSARAAARAAMRNVNTVRDARWLEKNPIAYA